MYYSDDNDTRIINHMERQLHYANEHHNKVLLIRFDVHFPKMGYLYDGGNREISSLIKSLKAAYKGRLRDIQYAWARERIDSQHPHWHLMLLIDGAIMQNPYGLLKKAEEIWNRILGGEYQGLIEFCDNRCMGHKTTGSVMMRRPSSEAEGAELIRQQQAYQAACGDAIWRASYLAKSFSKDEPPYRNRRFGCSQVPRT
ncbi:inovirus-type Gp2 protein [Magnetospirillum sp. SS-4]|uniref:YagK/YfjJ domain-containing protein n=1 Tax=Magnetospirillum sp. SS-4 TaxID=2681465 RepID=UPI0015733035|nr:inovirus-type Gp2 protein [Magnetospirillum sp. SS-4]